MSWCSSAGPTTGQVRGFRIELGEIESVVADCPAWFGPWSCSATTGRATERLVGYALADPADVTPERLAPSGPVNVPTYMVPVGVRACSTRYR